MSNSQTPQPIRGTQSLLGEEADRFHEVVAAFDRVRRLYGFKRVEVPLIEPTGIIRALLILVIVAAIAGLRLTA